MNQESTSPSDTTTAVAASSTSVSAENTAEGSTMENTSCLSKSALRRIRREQRYLEKQQSIREKRRQKKKERKERLRTNPPDPQKILMQDQQRKIDCREFGSLTRFDVIIDLSFDNLMTDKEISSLCKQLNWCYSVHKKSLSEFGPGISLKFLSPADSKTLLKLDSYDYKNWKNVSFQSSNCSDPFTGLYQSEQLVNMIYLTSESDNLLESVLEHQVLVIGGLVDKNRHKGLCYEKAIRLGMKTARLPIKESIDLNSRSVITINQVYEIISRINELKARDWKQVLTKVLPKRKLL